ncbi:MAG: nucleotidyltransferase domain-containing protein [Bacteroidota bacterium]
MTISDLKEKNLLLLECISGSRAYGLDTPESDTDIRGVYILPKEQFYSMDYVGQVNNETNDESYYELGKFIDLLTKNNPNILELLNTPEDCVLFKHPIIEKIESSVFLSKLCEQTFGQYAMTQVKKARGLKKKILNPVEKERKTILDFCFVPSGQGSMPVMEYLVEKGINQEECGLSKIPHMHEIYALYHDPDCNFKGIVKKKNAHDISLSSIPKGLIPLTMLSVNISGYSAYCKDYKAYWDWVAERNESRYEGTMSHGKRYDAKNMMHTFRLIAMAEDIGSTGIVNVRRKERDFLLSIKKGEFEYEDLLQQAESRMKGLKAIFETSDLADYPDKKAIEQLHYQIRTEIYESAG